MILVHQFPLLQTGRLVKRHKRFLADILLGTGETITAHCPNTGPMTGVCTVGSRVAVSYQPAPTRKLPYTWEMIEVQGTWVGINTSLPNRVIGQMLNQQLLPQFQHYPTIQREVIYGAEGSRIDFLLENGRGEKVYLEVKNTTWSQAHTAIFPDTETTRGQKHLRELIRVRQTPNTRAVVLYFIHRGDCDRWRSGDEVDPEYGKLLRQAITAGVEILPCRFQVDPKGIVYLGLAELELKLLE